MYSSQVVKSSRAKRFRAGDLEGLFETSIEVAGLWVEVDGPAGLSVDVESRAGVSVGAGLFLKYLSKQICMLDCLFFSV